MVFFAEKVRRKLEGNFTFVLMTDRKDLDNQIYKTFVGCGIAHNQTPRAESGEDLERLLKENHRYVFTLIHKFNRYVNPNKPNSSSYVELNITGRSVYEPAGATLHQRRETGGG